MGDPRTYALLQGRLDHGPAATATVVRTKGSTPREVGAQMVVQSGGTWGTIGGGCGEGEVIATAREMLLSEAGSSSRRLIRIDLTERALETSDRICGGIMDVLVEVWSGPVMSAVAAELASPKGDLVRIVPLGEGSAELWKPGPDRPGGSAQTTAHSVCVEVRETGRSRVATIGGESPEGDRFFELVTSPETLLVCGAGHIAQPLAQIGRLLDFRVVVIDDRSEYASPERFADADQVLALPFAEALHGLEITEKTLAILVTRGHRHDELCLRELLGTDVAYIGMLGSRRRVKAIFDELGAEGIGPDQLDRVWAPVGLDLGANTPAEIAISILAEIVALRNGRSGAHPHLRRGAGE